MTQPALPFRPVVRVHFFCAKCFVPAVWRVSFGDSFWTVCEMHFGILVRMFPHLEARSRALLPDEAPGAGLLPFHAAKEHGKVIIGGKEFQSG